MLLAFVQSAALAAVRLLTQRQSLISSRCPAALRPAALAPLQTRRGSLLRGGARAAGAGGRPRGEAEEREFRRRAAALNIQISPYFSRSRRPGSGGP